DFLLYSITIFILDNSITIINTVKIIIKKINWVIISPQLGIFAQKIKKYTELVYFFSKYSFFYSWTSVFVSVFTCFSVFVFISLNSNIGKSESDLKPKHLKNSSVVS